MGEDYEMCRDAQSLKAFGIKHSTIRHWTGRERELCDSPMPAGLRLPASLFTAKMTLSGLGWTKSWRLGILAVGKGPPALGVIAAIT